MQKLSTTRARPKPARTTSRARGRTKPVQKPRISPELRAAFQNALQSARIERRWFNNRPMVAGKAIQRAISRGLLVKVDDVAGLVRVVHSTGTLGGVQYPYLTPECRELLLGIAKEFGIRRDALKLGKFFLSITSMTRDAERQEALRKEGYPATRQSTHGFGEAFDINVRFLSGNAPAHFEIIRGILEARHLSEEINFIDEIKINGAFHVARNPHYKKPLA
ncbi:MAG: DUF5715 family protein [archaeon]|nr:DUF5715 family protein [archaeon]